MFYASYSVASPPSSTLPKPRELGELLPVLVCSEHTAAAAATPLGRLRSWSCCHPGVSHVCNYSSTFRTSCVSVLIASVAWRLAPAQAEPEVPALGDPAQTLACDASRRTCFQLFGMQPQVL